MIAELIRSTNSLRIGKRTIIVGLAAFVVLAGAFFVVAFLTYRHIISVSPDPGFFNAIVLILIAGQAGLFIAATFSLGLTGMALAQQGSETRLRDLRTSLIAARRDPANASKQTLPDNFQGRLGDVVAAANDLFEQVSANHWDALRYMQTMASQTSDAIIAYDEDGVLLHANRACVALCGVETFENLKAETSIPSFVMSPESDPVSLPDCLAKGSFSKEVVMIGKDDRETVVYLNAARLPVSHQFPTRFYANITDVSELRASQEKLEKQNLALTAANRAKSEFLANMSHELRTPLNAIIGFSEIMKNQAFGPLGSDQYLEYIQDIHDGGNHLVAIINDILDLSKIESGRMELQESKLPVKEVIGSCVRLMRERAENAEVKLVVSVPDNLPDILADARLVKQMLINLMSNAVKFTPAGGSVAICAQNKAKALLIGVADTGPGMNREEAMIALEPFRQVDGAHTRQQEGTGLGLPLVKSYIELHGGGFRLDSGPGKGTMVTLTFPPERTLSTVLGQAVA